MPSKVVHNFGKNLSFTPSTYAEPGDEEEVLKLLSQHRDQSIRVVASRHAWSDAIETDGLLICVKHLNHVRVTSDRESVWVGAGCQLKHLLPQLAAQGLTLPSLGLIDEQTVAGATATGTHGSGKHSLSHYIRRVRVAHFDLQTGEPTITQIDAGPELKAARCSLGLLGVIVELELEARPVYHVQEFSKRQGSLRQMLAMEKEYPLQQFFFMPWSWHLFGQHRVETNRPCSRTASVYRVYWHVGIDWCLHSIIFLLAKILQLPVLIRAFYRIVLPLLIVRNWRVTDDSHAMLTMEHELFRHIEIELFVSRSNLEAALAHVRQAISVFGGQNSGDTLSEPIPERHHGSYCHHYPICVRRILADDSLISMASPMTAGDNEDWYAISLICYHWPGQRTGFFNFAKYLAASMLSLFNARCHWGKYNPLDRNANEQLYPQLSDFREIVRQFDPEARFCNEWLSQVLLEDKANQGRSVNGTQSSNRPQSRLGRGRT